LIGSPETIFPALDRIRWLHHNWMLQQKGGPQAAFSVARF
jgi:hypothetical protein